MDGARIRSCCGRAQHEWMVAAEERNQRGATRRPPIAIRTTGSSFLTTPPRHRAHPPPQSTVRVSAVRAWRTAKPDSRAESRQHVRPASPFRLLSASRWPAVGAGGAGSAGRPRPAARLRTRPGLRGVGRRRRCPSRLVPVHRLRGACVRRACPWAAVRAPRRPTSRVTRIDRACIQFSQPVRHSPGSPRAPCMLCKPSRKP